MATSFEKTYPAISRWVRSHGWIELGQDGWSHSFARALDEGGLVWEGQGKYETLDEALQALDMALANWMNQYKSNESL